MKIVRFVVIVLFATVLCACAEKRGVDQLEDLSTELSQESANYSDEEWAVALERFEAISEELDKHVDEYTDEELVEIGRLKGACAVYFFKRAAKEAASEIHSGLKQLEGGIQGAMEALENDSSLTDF